MILTRKAVKHVSVLLAWPLHVGPGPVKSLVNVTKILLQGMIDILIYDGL